MLPEKMNGTLSKRKPNTDDQPSPVPRKEGLAVKCQGHPLSFSSLWISVSKLWSELATVSGSSLPHQQELLPQPLLAASGKHLPRFLIEALWKASIRKAAPSLSCHTGDTRAAAGRHKHSHVVMQVQVLLLQKSQGSCEFLIQVLQM